MSSVEIGSKLAHYEILAKIGEGGMGEVYRARDTKLGREIALKVLPPEVASNQIRRSRFEREAKAVAALNHPNIITLHSIEEVDDVRFITMEIVEGQTLSEVIQSASSAGEASGVDSREFLDLAVPIVDAIAAAHERNITHRDLKPQNILVTRDGRPKVLDFGLAKQALVDDTPASYAETAVKTAEGVIVGTVAYMSPEQAHGDDVDHRSDIFSLGVVFYEMISGRRPFGGNSAMQIIDKLVHAEPPAIDPHGDTTVAEIVRIISKCLQKDRERRYQSARELRVDLDNLRSADTQSRVATSTPATMKLSRRTWVAIGIAAVLMAIGVAFVATRESNEASQIESVAVLPFSNETGDSDNDYLGEGIAESVINSLSQESGLRVISRTSAFRFNEQSSLDDIAQQLGVAAVVLGRIGQRGDQLRISAELVEIPDGRQIWGDSFNRLASDLLTLETELSGTIASKLRGQLSSAPTELAAKRQPENPEAYQNYLRARLFLTGTSRDMDKAVELLDKAVDLDPGYALAWAVLAEISAIQGVYALSDPAAAIADARRSSARAISLDPSLAEAHSAAAMVEFYFNWDWETADREYRRAIELSPGSPFGYVEYADFLSAMGKYREAIETSKKVVELDPLSTRGFHGQGFGYLLLGEYDMAAEMFQKALDTNPSWTWGYVKGAKALAEAGRCEESLEALAVAEQRLAGGSDLLAQSWLGGSYAVCGNVDAAMEKLALINSYEEEWFVDPVIPMAIYAALDMKEETLRLAELALERHTPLNAFAYAMPSLWMPELSEEPRFQEILRKMNLPLED